MKTKNFNKDVYTFPIFALKLFLIKSHLCGKFFKYRSFIDFRYIFCILKTPGIMPGILRIISQGRYGLKANV